MVEGEHLLERFEIKACIVFGQLTEAESLIRIDDTAALVADAHLDVGGVEVELRHTHLLA